MDRPLPLSEADRQIITIVRHYHWNISDGIYDIEKDAKTRKRIEDHILQLRADLTAAQERKDGAYLERNRVVSALSKVFPSGVARTAIEGWSEDWHGCVYIDSPAGQLSWHFHDSQAYLFDHLPPYRGKWDGHTTEEKYARLAQIGGLAERLEKAEAAIRANGKCRMCIGTGQHFCRCDGQSCSTRCLELSGKHCQYCEGSGLSEWARVVLAAPK